MITATRTETSNHKGEYHLGYTWFKHPEIKNKMLK